MLDSLFSIFDIPLTIVLIALSFFTIFFFQTVYSLFLSLFVSIFVIIFTASTMLTQQVFLGEFLIISIFFIFAVLFFIFNSNYNYEDEELGDSKPDLSKIISLVVAFIAIFTIIGLNFYRIDTTDNHLIATNVVVQQELVEQSVNTEEMNNYKENVALLNQNNIFQKLTHIIMFYIGMVIILYFFNRKGEQDER